MKCAIRNWRLMPFQSDQNNIIFNCRSGVLHGVPQSLAGDNSKLQLAPRASPWLNSERAVDKALDWASFKGMVSENRPAQRDPQTLIINFYCFTLVIRREPALGSGRWSLLAKTN
ncbi:hypothetical protein N7475_005320 [Penicillium sp. IBT 31633x]|nr:hypothetical protein N7475_005320 [Penicillium sp. IBT 31633x]